MTAPAVNFTIVNGGLGNTPQSPAQTVCVLGCSSAGTVNTVSGPYSDPNKLITDYGYGPGVEMAAALIASGSQPLFIKLTSTTAGVAGSVTHTGTGVSVMTITGAPLDRYNAIVTMTRSGTVGTDPEPAFTISLDGGVTVSSEIRMPSGGVYAIAGTGMSLNFTVATIVKGDTYTFTTTQPLWGNTDITNSVAALKVSPKLASMLYLVGPCNATAAGVLNTAIGSFLAAKRPIRAMVETVDFTTDEATWITTIQNDYVTFTSDLISVAAGPILYPSAISGIQYRRSCGMPAMVRTAGLPVSQSSGEVALGALPSVTTVYHDESLVPGLDADRFLTLTSIPGLSGYYVTRPNVMRSVGSDYTELQYGRVMDQAIRIAYAFFVERLNSRVRLNRTTGFILEKDARSLESGSDAALASGLVNTGDLSDAQTVVSRTDNISSTKTLTVTIRLLPVGYLEYIIVTLLFTNPALGA